MGTQTVTIQKVAQLLERINPETCTNVIAIKDGNQPLVYLMAVPFNLRERLQNLLALGCIGNETVVVTEEDYGEAQEESKA